MLLDASGSLGRGSCECVDRRSYFYRLDWEDMKELGLSRKVLITSWGEAGGLDCSHCTSWETR